MFTNWSLFSVWLVTSPKLLFPLSQDLPESSQKLLEEFYLWMTDVSNLREDFICYLKYDEVIQVALSVGYICLLSLFLLLLLLLFFIVTLETQSNCPVSVCPHF